MLKYVRNVTSGDYILKCEIMTVNGKRPITVRIIKDGVYEVDPYMTYQNLEDALKAGDLVPVGDKVEKVVKPDNTTKSTEEVIETKNEEEPKDVETTDNSTDEGEGSEEENPEPEVTETPEDTKDKEQVADSPVIIPEVAPFICPYCQGEYASKNNLLRHIEKAHSNNQQ